MVDILKFKTEAHAQEVAQILTKLSKEEHAAYRCQHDKCWKIRLTGFEAEVLRAKQLNQ